jgi:hypothetical protein
MKYISLLLVLSLSLCFSYYDSIMKVKVRASEESIGVTHSHSLQAKNVARPYELGDANNAISDLKKLFDLSNEYRRKFEGSSPKGFADLIKFFDSVKSTPGTPFHEDMFVNPDSKFADAPTLRSYPNKVIPYFWQACVKTGTW